MYVQPGTGARGRVAGAARGAPSTLWNRLPVGAWPRQSQEQRWAPCEARGNSFWGCAGHRSE